MAFDRRDVDLGARRGVVDDHGGWGVRLGDAQRLALVGEGGRCGKQRACGDQAHRRGRFGARRQQAGRLKPAVESCAAARAVGPEGQTVVTLEVCQVPV